VSAGAPQGPRATSAPELKAQIEAERLGRPFLVYRDADGEQQILPIGEGVSELWVGRSGSTDLRLDFDSEVSGLHAQIEIIGSECTLIDDGLSRNGSYVNGDRIAGRRRLRHGDRLCFGETPVLFRAPGSEGSLSTAVVGARQGDIPLTEAQRRILVALCRPLRDSAYATPATNRAIAEEVHLSVDAVKAHLRLVFERLDLDDLPQNQKRARLAALALVNGLVRQHDF
jgi:pSer/pThr/pTyr-binding forkhead associated (FHA) protein